MRGVHVLVLFFFAAVTAAAQMQVNPLQINWTAVTGSGAPALYCPTTITGTTTNGSKSVVLTSFTGVLVNQTVTGTGVASGSTVSAVSVPNETVTLSLAATASGTTALSLYSYGLPYTDITNNVQYTCSAGGWTKSIGTNGTVNAGLMGQVAYYPANGVAVSGETAVPSTAGGTGTTSLTGLRYATASAPDIAASSSQVQTVIGAGVYDPSGAAATAQSNAEAYAASQAATAQSNAETYAASQAATAQSNAETYASNASNLSSGTVNVARMPTAIPVANVGSAGLSGTSPIQIASSGAISCPTCNTSTAAVTQVNNLDGTLAATPNTGNVVVSLNTAHPNIWTATQTLPNGSVTNAELTSDTTTVNSQPCTLGSSCTVTVPVSGPAGGDLSGTYPDPVVAQVNGAAVPLSKTIVGTNSSGQITDASAATLANNTTGTAANVTGVVAAVNGGTGEAGVFSGLRQANGASADTAANSSQVQTVIGAGVYDPSGAAATAQSNAETYASNASNLSSGTVNVARMPTAIPVANVGSAGLSGTSPIQIASSGAISCPTCNTSTAVINSGTTGQVAYYAANGTALSGTTALPNGTTATTQSPGDGSTNVSTDAFVANAATWSGITGGTQTGSGTGQVNTLPGTFAAPITNGSYYPLNYTGGDVCTQIRNAYVAMPPQGGHIDVRGLDSVAGGYPTPSQYVQCNVNFAPVDQLTSWHWNATDAKMQFTTTLPSIFKLGEQLAIYPSATDSLAADGGFVGSIVKIIDAYNYEISSSAITSGSGATTATAASEYKRIELELGPGVIYMTQPLVNSASHFTLKGAGSGNTIFVWQGTSAIVAPSGGPGGVFEFATGNPGAVYFGGAQISDLGVIGSAAYNAYTPYAILVDGFNNGIFSNIGAVGGSACDLQIGFAVTTDFYSPHVGDSYGQSVAQYVQPMNDPNGICVAGDNTALTASAITIENPVVDNHGRCGIYVDNAFGLHVHGNTIEANGINATPSAFTYSSGQLTLTWASPLDVRRTVSVNDTMTVSANSGDALYLLNGNTYTVTAVTANTFTIAESTVTTASGSTAALFGNQNSANVCSTRGAGGTDSNSTNSFDTIDLEGASSPYGLDIIDAGGDNLFTNINAASQAIYNGRNTMVKGGIQAAVTIGASGYSVHLDQLHAGAITDNGTLTKVNQIINSGTSALWGWPCEEQQDTYPGSLSSSNGLRPTESLMCQVQFPSASPAALSNTSFGTGTVQWVAVFTGQWYATGMSPTAMPGIVTLDSNNPSYTIPSSSGTVVTFSVNSSTGKFQGRWTTAGVGAPVYSGAIMITPIGSGASSANPVSAAWSSGIQAAAFWNPNGNLLPATLTGYHGNASGVKVPLALNWTNTAGAVLCDDGNGNLTITGCSVPTGANPSATATGTAINGSATTFMRSDAAPAIQTGSGSQKGLIASADWTTFNNKAATGACTAGQYTTTTTTSGVTCAQVQGSQIGGTVNASQVNGAAVPASAAALASNSSSQIIASPSTYGCLDGYDHQPCTVYKSAVINETSVVAPSTVYTTTVSGTYRVCGLLYQTSASSTAATLYQQVIPSLASTPSTYTTFIVGVASIGTLLSATPVAGGCDSFILTASSAIQVGDILTSGTLTGGAWSRNFAIELIAH